MMMLLMAGALVFQLFFRYEHWTGGPHRDMTYERDNLTGETHTVRPGERVDFMARLLGNSHWGQNAGKNNDTGKTWLDADPMRDEDRLEEAGREKAAANKDEEAIAMNMTASPTVQRTTLAPVPPTPDAKAGPDKKHELWESEDLNGDGRLEEVIQTQAADGMMDISVLSGSKELFYGRGKRLVVLPTRSQGWSDLQLKVSDQQTLRFRFNPAVDGYELGSSK
jgi:hypothetical protein